jgi:hypothetical protein
VETLFLPAISAVDAADEKIGSFLSDLDMITSDVAIFAGDEMPLADAVFMSKHGIKIPTGRPRHADPATIARLLVFANEIVDDADSIKRDAEKLREALLSIYRNHVIDGRRFTRAEA